MKWIIEVLFLTIVEICMLTATEIFYVLPDNSTNASCTYQPCATLSQYWLPNGTLPVVSNVEYHFLPGEHYVPTNMVLQNLHNFSIIGIFTNLSSPVVLVCLHMQSYVINIINSHYVLIKNVWFKHYGTSFNKTMAYSNLKMFCCFSCRIENVIFLQYGFKAFNLIGDTYLHNINVTITQFAEVCCQQISLIYNTCPLWSDYNSQMHILIINQLVINDQKKFLTPQNSYRVGLLIDLKYIMYDLQLTLTNSHFSNMDCTAIYIKGGCSSKAKQLFITNCTFTLINYYTIIYINLKAVNISISFLNINFHNNKYSQLIIRIGRLPSAIGCKLFNINSAVPAVINVSFIKYLISGSNNYQYGKLLTIENNVATLDGVNIFFEFLSITENIIFSGIKLKKVNVHFTGSVYVCNNNFRSSIIRFQSCNVMFNGKFKFDKNYCDEIITVDTYIKVLEYTKISFVKNMYRNSLLAVESTEKYNQPNPLCLFQYIAMSSSTRKDLDVLSHYTITFYHNYHLNISKLYLYNSKICSVSVSFCDFISHCKWLPSAAFYNYSSTAINKQIIQSDDQICNYNHNHICYCSQNKVSNCSIDRLGVVYPGQMLQANFCRKCGNDDNIILYAEVLNRNLPNSTCKFAHQSQLISLIGDNSNTVNYTIVSSILNNNRCELFLTASPFLNEIYDVFYVQLLPCPVGFTLQDGICDCDPILSEYIDKCFIDHSNVRCPPNTWITALKQTSNNTKYLISDCPMDYCLPYSSNVNLLHPDVQCQFNRTGILCSQCQQHLSMVFGSSRCMECTNLYILITIIVVVAGIVLVILLYLLNLTVTIGTINGIILYTNIVSINNSVFLMNDNVFKPLRVFISFTNLDLGIETCFYNGMDSYTKTWLQLFFPIYLMIIAVSIIIASRYSYRILRLTYTRSLPVLATLFMLSYNGVLRIVLTVLFSYSIITHLPSGHQQIVWSIDVSVPLFGLKFTILFITCLLLFVILIPFNITLLFTRYLLQFGIINRFKPLLDAFQASYKDKYYYWVAVNVILRGILFSFYLLQIKLRLILANMILVLFTVYHGISHPNKSKLVNIQEILLLANLTIMHSVSYQSSETIFCIVTNIMMSLAFIQFCIIVLYHFLTYTCHCDIVIALQTGKENLMRYFTSKESNCQLQVELLDIPECTYNYTAYQDGLISDDFN